MTMFNHVVAIAGGVGGARLADGLARAWQAHPADIKKLTVIVNTGDDFEHLGLRICPDLDTVCYTLSGLSNPATGWGQANETYNALETVGTLSGPTWFRLGDHDLGVHLERTRRLNLGQPLSQITRHFCKAWGIRTEILPMTDDNVPTWVYTEEGELPFQEYFVHRQCHPRVTGFRFADVERAHPAPGVLAAIESADLLVFCPSNPWVSVDPILAVPGIRAAMEVRRGTGIPIVSVSPIIAGQTVKGPAAKMFAELGIEPSALAVARHYGSLLNGFVLDQMDAGQAGLVRELGMEPRITDTLMKTPGDRQRLAEEVLEFSHALKAL